MKYTELGSISHGTMREEDLIPAFLDELIILNPKEADRIQHEVDKLIIDDSGYYDDKVIVSDIKLTSSELAIFILNEDLFNALNDYAPPFCYFGSHPGDGSDYGFWIDSYSLEECLEFDSSTFDNILFTEDYKSDIQFEEIKFPLKEYNYVLHINDHGNTTLYDKYGQEIWSVV